MDLLLAPTCYNDAFFAPVKRRPSLFDLLTPLAAVEDDWLALPEHDDLPLEFSEGDAGYCISARLPGVRPDQLKLRLRNGALHIGLQVESEDEQHAGGSWAKSVSTYHVERTVDLPEDADTDAMAAELQADGNFVITLPRLAIEDGTVEQAAPVAIAVERGDADAPEEREPEGTVEDVIDGDD